MKDLHNAINGESSLQAYYTLEGTAKEIIIARIVNNHYSLVFDRKTFKAMYTQLKAKIGSGSLESGNDKILRFFSQRREGVLILLKSYLLN